MERAVGVELGPQKAAYPVGDITDAHAINDELDGTPLALLLAPGSTAATDDSDITGSRQVGQVGVFERTLDGQVISFEAGEEGVFHDAETGSTWTITDRAIAGELEGSQLAALAHVVFWFAWAAAFPDTRLWTG